MHIKKYNNNENNTSNGKSIPLLEYIKIWLIPFPNISVIIGLYDFKQSISDISIVYFQIKEN